MAKDEPARMVTDKDKKATEKGVLYVGIDLGTSRTSVSASNGVRETVYSFVGYPKDVVAKKLLKKDVLFGKEAVEKRLSLDLYRPFEKGFIKFSNDETASVTPEEAANYMKAAKDLVKFALTIVKPRKDGVWCFDLEWIEPSLRHHQARCTNGPCAGSISPTTA